MPQPTAVPNPASPLNNLRLDVRIVSAPELTVQTTLAKLSGDVDLRLRGTGTRPSLLGRINIAEGDINLNGTKYHLDRGDVTFANSLRIDPILDVEATTRVRDFDITIGLHGTTGQADHHVSLRSAAVERRHYFAAGLWTHAGGKLRVGSRAAGAWAKAPVAQCLGN